MSTENKPDLPASGYSLIKVYTPHFELSHAQGSQTGPQSVLSFGSEWRKRSDDDFDVLLKVKIDPSGDRPERLVVHLVGQFKRVGTPTLSIEDFANMNAVAILFPYLRQQLTTATMSSFFGPFYLPMVNVSALMARRKVSQQVTSTEQQRRAIRASKKR